MTTPARARYYRDNSRYAQALGVTRPKTAPAYFRGLPATFWVSIFRDPKSRDKK